MNDGAFTPTSNSKAIRVHLDPEILHELIYGDEPVPRDENARAALQRQCALREHQVYRLLRGVVSQFNNRLKGRRERMKLVEEGEGLFIEFSG